MEQRKYLIILSPGPGTELSGKDLLQICIERFAAACPGIRVITVLPGNAVQEWQRYCATRNFNHPQSVVQAGFTPYHSLRKALGKVPSESLVAIHDGQSPLVSAALIGRLFGLCATRSAGIVPVCPAEGTPKRILPGDVPEDAIPGAALSFSQLPQVFPSDLIRQAYEGPYDTAFTDPASVAQANKIPLIAVAGERYNIRVVTPEDRAVAAALLRALTSGNS